MNPDMMNIQERPLITFALIAYNQERFIREAVEGAFSQTYSPLEIILSDDSSPDGTFKVIRQMAAEYRGPHKIVLNQNSRNLGVGMHVNRIMEISQGEIIVAAAGDDVSLPDRTAEIYEAWMKSDKNAFSLHSKYEMIDECGNLTSSPAIRHLPHEHQLLFFSKTISSRVCGSTHAWHRRVFDVFGPLPNITLEDHAIPPRSMLLGNVAYIDKPLVKYRTHSNNIWMSSKPLTIKNAIEKHAYYLNDRISICDDVVRCINDYKSHVTYVDGVRELDTCISNITATKKQFILRLNILTGYPIIRLFHLIMYAYLYGFQRSDLFWIISAISMAAAQLSFSCKRIILRTFSTRTISS